MKYSALIKKWTPSILAAAAALAPVVVPEARVYLGHHEEIAQLILGLYAIFCHTSKSPLS